MLQEMSRKTWDGMLYGVDAARDTMGRVRLRKPWTYRNSWKLGASPWLMGSLAAVAAFIGMTVFFYFRKRRHVANHYTMGDTGEIGGSGSTSAYGMETADGIAKPQSA
jgi:hypothetical protein